MPQQKPGPQPGQPDFLPPQTNFDGPFAAPYVQHTPNQPSTQSTFGYLEPTSDQEASTAATHHLNQLHSPRMEADLAAPQPGQFSHSAGPNQSAAKMTRQTLGHKGLTISLVSGCLSGAFFSLLGLSFGSLPPSLSSPGITDLYFAAFLLTSFATLIGAIISFVAILKDSGRSQGALGVSAAIATPALVLILFALPYWIS